ncbi:MAG: hypothetical protein FCO83_02820, partial [Spiroplasma sp. WSS]
MRERITFHWRHIKYIEGKIINLEFLIKNQEQEKNNLKSEMNLLRIEKDKKNRILEQQKNNFNNIKSIVNHEKKYNDSNKPNTSYSNCLLYTSPLWTPPSTQQKHHEHPRLCPSN